MSIRNTATTYGSVAKFFHWLLFFLLTGMVIFGYFLDDVPEEYKGASYNLHKLIGLSILILVLLRGLWALMNPKPMLPSNTKSWQRWAEHSVHFGLYFVIIAMPIAGWIGSTAAGHIPHIGSYQLALPIAENKELADQAFGWHGLLAYALIALASVHILAALYHYFIKKDNILQRML